jgi:hypothetical protein
MIKKLERLQASAVMWLPLILLILVVQPTTSIHRCDKLRLCIAPLEALVQAPIAGRRRLWASGIVGLAERPMKCNAFYHLSLSCFQKDYCRYNWQIMIISLFHDPCLHYLSILIIFKPNKPGGELKSNPGLRI